MINALRKTSSVFVASVLLLMASALAVGQPDKPDPFYQVHNGHMVDVMILRQEEDEIERAAVHMIGRWDGKLEGKAEVWVRELQGRGRVLIMAHGKLKQGAILPE